MWATTYTYTFTSNVWSSNGSAYLGGIDWTLNMDGGTISTFSATSGMHFGTNNNTCNSVSISTSSISGTITSVAVECCKGSSVKGNLAITVGGESFKLPNSNATATLTTDNATYTFNGSNTGKIDIKWTKSSGNGAFYIKSITVTYTVPLTFNLIAKPNDESFGTVSISGNEITATPADGYRISTTNPYEVTDGTATVTQNGNVFTVSATVDCTIQINFEPVPTYDVNWYINGVLSSTDKYKEGDAVNFPTNVTDIAGMSFMGWVDTEITGTTDEAQAFVTSATMGTTTLNYYAVFAKKKPGDAVTKTDILTAEQIGRSSYGDWSGKIFTSSAEYAGNSTMTSDGAIQIRSNNENSGIVTTQSGGRAVKITVIWNEENIKGRTLDVYGKNSAYSTASDLYSSTTTIQGTKLGRIVFGTSAELTISGDYTFIGLRSNYGAMYLDKISIDWVSGTPDSYSGYLTTFSSVDVTLAASCYASYCSQLPLDLTPTDNYAAWAVTGVDGTAVTFTKIEGAVPAETPFILYGKDFGGNTATLPVATGETTAVTGNMLKGTLTPTDVTTEMEVDGVACTLFGLSSGSFVKISSGTIPANKAYLPIPTADVPSGARLAIVFADETTGIAETVQAAQRPDTTVYDLQGRKVRSLQGNAKGLYIVNGKKVLVK